MSHLRRRDAVLRGVIDSVGPLGVGQWTRGRPKDAFGSLLRSIVGQQLSVHAARAIFGRVVDANGGSSPTPQELLRMRETTLRRCGLSGTKIAYTRDLARRFRNGTLDARRIRRLDDEGVRDAITEVKGLGRWTADMFLMFHLRRPDVLPVGDLGLRRAVERAYRIPLPDAARLESLAEPWRPYRTIASLYLWESLGIPPTIP
ncbi:MAG: DNA-3-methyladenine glycosylase [Chloroflexi bacterium]|nr:DNA-3-methyladenine glycosylase [Chloroflexota bacterium]